MKLSTILLLLLCCVGANAQNKFLDSLQLVFNTNQNLTINEKREILNEFAFHHAYSGNPNLGVEYSNQIIALGDISRNKDISATGYLRRANSYQLLSKDSSANQDYLKAISLLSEGLNYRGLASIYQNLSIFHHSRGRYIEALKLLDLAIVAAEKSGNQNVIAYCFNSRGVNQLELDMYPQAIESYLGALKVFSAQRDTANMATAEMNIGIVFNRMAQPEEAIKRYQVALAMLSNRPDSPALADCYGNLGNSYSDIGNVNEGFRCYNESIIISERIKYGKGKANQELNKGDMLVSLGRQAEAFPLMTKAIRYYKEVNNAGTLAEAYIALAKCTQSMDAGALKSIGLSEQSTIDSTYSWLNKAIELTIQTGKKTFASEAFEERSKLNQSEGIFEAALEDYKMSVAYRDSAWSEEKKVEIVSQTLEHEKEKQRIKLQTQTDRQRTRKEAAIVISLAVLICLIIGWGLYKRKRDVEMKSAQMDFQLVQTETEMKALRAQMNPHFIFNALNSIAYFIRKNEKQVADDYLAKFARLMRMVLQNSEHKLISLDKDMETLTLYIQLEQLRMNYAFTFTFQLDETIDIENTLIPPLLLQPFVENSIWHGFNHLNRIGELTIAIAQKDNALVCTIEDNGSGRHQLISSNSKRQKSMGVDITRARIEQMNPVISDKEIIHYTNLLIGTRVEVSLPLTTNF